MYLPSKWAADRLHIGGQCVLKIDGCDCIKGFIEQDTSVHLTLFKIEQKCVILWFGIRKANSNIMQVMLVRHEFHWQILKVIRIICEK